MFDYLLGLEEKKDGKGEAEEAEMKSKQTTGYYTTDTHSQRRGDETK